MDRLMQSVTMISEHRSGKLLQILQTDVIFFSCFLPAGEKKRRSCSLLCVISDSLMPAQSAQLSRLLNGNGTETEDSCFSSPGSGSAVVRARLHVRVVSQFWSVFSSSLHDICSALWHLRWWPSSRWDGDTFLHLRHGSERTRVGERVCCYVCVGDGWGLQVAEGRKRETFQTPTHRLLLPSLPQPPTDTFHVLEGKCKS